MISSELSKFDQSIVSFKSVGVSDLLARTHLSVPSAAWHAGFLGNLLRLPRQFPKLSNAKVKPSHAGTASNQS